MSYNIHAWRDSHHQDNFDRIVDCVQQVRPDILCLNEVLEPFCKPKDYSGDYYSKIQNNQRNVDVPTSFLPPNPTIQQTQYNDDNNNNQLYTSFLDRLAQATDLTNVEFAPAATESFFGRGSAFGNAILTKFEIKDVSPCHLIPDPEDVHLGNQPRDFVEPRAFSSVQVACCTDDNWTIGVGVTHLDHKSEELREKQIVKGIRESANRCFCSNDDASVTIPHVICGDWNTFQKSDCNEKGWSKILSLYEDRGWPTPPEESLVIQAVRAEGYMDTFYEQTTRKSPPAATAWTVDPLMRIDHMFVKNSDNPIVPHMISITDHFRVKTDASDHFPIVVDLNVVAKVAPTAS